MLCAHDPGRHRLLSIAYTLYEAEKDSITPDNADAWRELKREELDGLSFGDVIGNRCR